MRGASEVAHPTYPSSKLQATFINVIKGPRRRCDAMQMRFGHHNWIHVVLGHGVIPIKCHISVVSLFPCQDLLKLPNQLSVCVT